MIDKLSNKQKVEKTSEMSNINVKSQYCQSI